MKALLLYALHGSFHVVKRLLEAVKSRALLRQWVRGFTEVLHELIKGCQRLLAGHGVFPSAWTDTVKSSCRAPPHHRSRAALLDAYTKDRGVIEEANIQRVLADFALDAELAD